MENPSMVSRDTRNLLLDFDPDCYLSNMFAELVKTAGPTRLLNLGAVHNCQHFHS